MTLFPSSAAFSATAYTAAVFAFHCCSNCLSAALSAALSPSYYSLQHPLCCFLCYCLRSCYCQSVQQLSLPPSRSRSGSQHSLPPLSFSSPLSPLTFLSIIATALPTELTTLLAALPDLHAALTSHSTTPSAALPTASTTAPSTAITALPASLNVILPDALIATLPAALAPTTLETFSNASEAGAPCSQHCLLTSDYAHVTLWKTQPKPSPGHVHATLYLRNPITKPITHQEWMINKKPFFTNTPPNLPLPHLEVQPIFNYLLSTKHKYQGTITPTTLKSVVLQYHQLVPITHKSHSPSLLPSPSSLLTSLTTQNTYIPTPPYPPLPTVPSTSKSIHAPTPTSSFPPLTSQHVIIHFPSTSFHLRGPFPPNPSIRSLLSLLPSTLTPFHPNPLRNHNFLFRLTYNGSTINLDSPLASFPNDILDFFIHLPLIGGTPTTTISRT